MYIDIVVKSFSIFILVTILLLAAGCGPTLPVTDQPAASEATATLKPAVVQPTPVPTEPPTAAPSLIPSPVPVQVEKTSGPLWIKIISPLDNSTVNTAEVEIKGSAPVETVLTINDEIVLVGSDQQFSAKVVLDEGINEIEILGSDISGNEIFIPLTIYYEK